MELDHGKHTAQHYQSSEQREAGTFPYMLFGYTYSRISWEFNLAECLSCRDVTIDEMSFTAEKDY